MPKIKGAAKYFHFLPQAILTIKEPKSAGNTLFHAGAKNCELTIGVKTVAPRIAATIIIIVVAMDAVHTAINDTTEAASVPVSIPNIRKVINAQGNF